jgi:hypothetical protein
LSAVHLCWELATPWSLDSLMVRLLPDEGWLAKASG